MKLSYVPELAALIAAHADLIAAEPERLTDDVLGQQYIACRDRSNRWMQEIDRYSGTNAFSAESLLARRHPLADLAERILINDVLIRTWAATLALADLTSESRRTATIARNLHLGQMVIRHRVLSRVVASSGPTRSEVNNVNSVREKAERWADMLIGQLGHDLARDFAFQPRRAEDFSRCYHADDKQRQSSHVWQLILTGVRSAFHSQIPESAVVSGDDRTVISTILAALSPEVTLLTRGELGPRVGSLQL